jgi:hypothetical protein
VNHTIMHIAYVELSGLAAAAIGGFALGTVFGHRAAAEVEALLHALESRVGAVEQSVTGKMASQNAEAAATNNHAAAIEKLAGAIEKHAAAVDDHGAATVAAAVEHNAAHTAKAN